MRAVALDYGRARCGVAVSDPTGTLATPAGVVERPGSDGGLRRIGALVRDRGAEVVVVGLPLTLSGGESEQAAEARDFAARLGEVIAPVRIELHDERLTTAQARRTGGEADEDARAAAHLLEAWLAARGA